MQAQREGFWFGSLGASLALHGGILIALLGLGWQHAAVPQAHPDIWQGDSVVVDTWSDEQLGAGTRGSEVEQAAAPAPLPVPAVRQSAPRQRTATVKHAERTEPEQVRATPTARPDPNAALLAKVMGFRPPVASLATEPQAAPVGALGRPEATDPGGAVLAGSSAATTVRNLPKAFTRALANAAASDSRTWARLPPGKVDEAHVTIQVGSKGEIVQHHLDREASLRVKELVRRTIASLGAGQFALKQLQVNAGTLELRLQVFLSGEAAEGERMKIGFEPPAPNRDGKAYFTMDEGWRFEAKVRDLGSP